MDITISVLDIEVDSICGWGLETHTRENDSLPKWTRLHAFREQPLYHVSCLGLERIALPTTLQIFHSTFVPHLFSDPELHNIQQMMLQLISNAERNAYYFSI